jgi:chemotaxis receptor (MCP) glutamine deamidase CheD
MERDIAKGTVLTISALVVADLLSHGAVTEALATTFFGGNGFFATIANLIAGK